MNKQYIEKLNVFLANQEVNFIKLHNMHWYIKGQGFFTLHAKLEELYEVTADIIDDVAERILAIEGTPIANLSEALALATIKEKESQPIKDQDVVQSLLQDNQYWLNDAKEIRDLAEEVGDKVTADLFSGYVGEYEKLNWMLKSFLA